MPPAPREYEPLDESGAQDSPDLGAGRPHAPGRSLPQVKGRGASRNPANRFEPLDVERDRWTDDDGRGPETRFYRDSSRSIITTNTSPDVGFEASVNPYRGCEHGCVYCYARPGHEYLGLSPGLDFESKIFVKEDAPELLQDELSSPSWEPRVLAMSGVTDPYQPVERELEITRGCLRVLADFRNPVSVITKSHTVTRDLDLLEELAAHGAARVRLSVTTLDGDLRRVMEPRTSPTGRRLAAIRELSDAGIPVGVMVAPVVPGLTDQEMPGILEAAAEAGARRASYILLRLPHSVKEIFSEWLEGNFPDRKGKVLNRIREMRGGRLNDPRFGSRMRGEGPYAEQLREMFRVTTRRLGLDGEDPPPSASSFRRPEETTQMELFGE